MSNTPHTPRQRFRKTLRFDSPEKIPFEPGWPRESTLAAWRIQGLPKDADWLNYLLDQLGLPPEAAYTQVNLDVDLAMLPPFEEKILEHRAAHFIVQDQMGAVVEISDQFDLSYLRSARDFVTRRWHSFPVTRRKDWDEKIRWRFDPSDPRRFPADFAAQCQAAQASAQVIALTLNGPFWQLRDWCGLEGLCFLMVEQPDFVQEMAEFWADFVGQIIVQLQAFTTLDKVLVNEDMAYKGHSMISPRMTRRFLLPVWQNWATAFKPLGNPVLMVDSDGYISELLPLFIEAGFEVTWPVEVAALNDIVAYRQQYGHQIAFSGGVDKRALAAGGEVMYAELDRLAPVITDGGYLPGCDHGVPSDISWPNFMAYARRLAELTGWL